MCISCAFYVHFMCFSCAFHVPFMCIHVPFMCRSCAFHVHSCAFHVPKGAYHVPFMCLLCVLWVHSMCLLCASHVPFLSIACAFMCIHMHSMCRSCAFHVHFMSISFPFNVLSICIHVHNAERAEIQRQLNILYAQRPMMEPQVQQLLLASPEAHIRYPLKVTKNWLQMNATTFSESVKRVKTRALQGMRLIRSYYSKEQDTVTGT